MGWVLLTGGNGLPPLKPFQLSVAALWPLESPVMDALRMFVQRAGRIKRG